MDLLVHISLIVVCAISNSNPSQYSAHLVIPSSLVILPAGRWYLRYFVTFPLGRSLIYPPAALFLFHYLRFTISLSLALSFSLCFCVSLARDLLL